MAAPRLKINILQTAQRLLDIGPSLPMEIGVGAKFIAVRALVDTGSDGCAMSQSALDRLGAVPTGTIAVQEANREAADLGAIEATLRFPKGPAIDLYFGVVASMGDHHDILIGRNLFEGGALFVDFTNGGFEMHLDSTLFRMPQ